jgi:dUTP pyrophosphatase
MKIKLKRLHKDAKIPTYAHKDDACADLYAVEDITIRPGEVGCVRSGWALEFPTGYYMEIRPRSSLACKKQLMILNSPSTIDSPYRGDLLTYMKNIGTNIVSIRKHDRYAQIMVKKVIPMNFEEVEELNKTSRGTSGFGSTGR